MLQAVWKFAFARPAFEVFEIGGQCNQTNKTEWPKNSICIKHRRLIYCVEVD